MGESATTCCNAPLVRRALRKDSKTDVLTVQDEPRRSSRANKGSNSDRWQEVLDSARHNIVSPESNADDTATDAGTVQTDGHLDQNGNDGADDDEIRCVCGQTSEVEDEDKDFVQCDNCHVWQHNQCVGLPSDIPDDQDYFCELCRPDLHQKLLKDLANGKKFSKVAVDKKRKRTNEQIKTKAPVDEAYSDEDKTEALSKRRRSSSASDLSIMSEQSEGIVARRRPSATTTKSKTVPVRSKTASNRDKLDQSAKHKSKTKTNKAGGKTKTTFNGPFESLNAIHDPERKKIATALVRLIGDTFKIATEAEGFVLSDDVSVDQAASSIGLQIEFAMFDARLDVRAKFRQLSFNLKDPKNPSLRKSVLDQSLTPAELVQMSSEDMANPELKAKTEALREESLKQSVLVQETGPRIRRTHKGEEYIEGPDPVAEGPDPSALANRSNVQEEGGSPVSIASFSSHDSGISSPESPKVPRRERTDSNFDIKNVWNHIESPADGESPAPPQRRESRSTSFAQDDGNDNDEDILGLLDDDQKNSKRIHNYASRETVWKGQVLMPGVSDLTASVTLLGGPRSFDVDWAATLTSCIRIDGRIPKPDASKYLCHQKFSQSKTVFALQIEAEAGKEAAFDSLNNYFIKKDRYGVIKPGKTRLRDGYIVPLSADAELPEFITMLPSFNLPAQRKDMLLAVLVLEKEAPAVTQPVPAPSPPKSIEPPQAESTIKSPPHQIPVSAAQQPPFRVHQWQSSPAEYAQHQQQQALPMRPQQPYMPQQYQQRRLVAEHAPQPPLLQRPMSHSPMPGAPPQLDQNAQAVLMAFLRAHPEVANNPQIISSPQIMATLLDAFVSEGGMMRR